MLTLALHRPEELAECEAFREAGAPRPTDAAIIVDLDEAGAIYPADKPSGPRSVPVLEIGTVVVASHYSASATSTSDAVGSTAGQEPHQEANKICTAPPIMDSKRLAERIKSTRLWKEHLEYLLSQEDKKHAAACAALQQNRPRRYSQSYNSIEDIVKHLETRSTQLAEATPDARLEDATRGFLDGLCECGLLSPARGTNQHCFL